ncbi:hypothetical protein L2K70_02220 [Nocardioides KLBMP 9356]|uniref:Lipoprotein n=1 Tax=Nocardioides potassii TaxID=2911371 RepID=A0ABS9H569_9ACTN|nr:hypothetical protein [Nocardioides potassii]MCF6376410.1 hypothetical protein [Nocardioides potassii]
MHVRLALALAGVLLLAGCTDDPDPTPKIPEPTSSSPSPTASESETPNAESAEDFIRKWAAVEAQMENTGETAEYRAMSKGCKACSELADNVERVYEAGGYLKWDGWQIKRITQREFQDNQYVVKVVSRPTEYKESSNGAVKKLAGGPGAHLLTLKTLGDSWLVVDKGAVSQ